MNATQRPNHGAALVTGGAGYVGSHTVLALLARGIDAVVIDDLSTGRRDLVPDGVPFVEGSAGDVALVRDTIRRHRCASVIHFAGSIVNPESFEKPLLYYRNNVTVSRDLLEACAEENIGAFIFSSSAAVYGAAEAVPIPETAPTKPNSPYGASKLMTEWMLRDMAAVTGTRYVALRYFNVAGADAGLRSGQAGPVATHLIKIAAEAAVGLRPGVVIHGDDYATPDGTCIRDYVHVADIADAHVAALRHLLAGGDTLVLNCGYGRGYSVRQVLETAARIIGRSLKVEVGPRRIGDVAELVADSRAIGKALGWKPRHGDLEAMIASAIRWEEKIAAGRPPTKAARETAL